MHNFVAYSDGYFNADTGIIGTMSPKCRFVLFRRQAAMGKMALTILTIAVFASGAVASEPEPEFDPWGKIEVTMGVFLSTANSSFRIGSGFGLDINVEDLLGMDATNYVFRVNASWRFTESRRHRLDLSWFSMHRRGNRDVLQDFEWIDSDGDTIYVNAGTRVASIFNLDIYKVSYNYSFFQDDRFDIAAKVGLFIMPIEFGLTTSGAVEEELNEAITAPLPAFGLHSDFAITPRWYLRLGTEVFYIKISQFRGGLFDTHGAVEYRPWRHLGIGLGFERFELFLEADGEDYPNIDFKGNIEFDYFGLQLYANLFF